MLSYTIGEGLPILVANNLLPGMHTYISRYVLTCHHGSSIFGAYSLMLLNFDFLVYNQTKNSRLVANPNIINHISGICSLKSCNLVGFSSWLVVLLSRNMILAELSELINGHRCVTGIKFSLIFSAIQTHSLQSVIYSYFLNSYNMLIAFLQLFDNSFINVKPLLLNIFNCRE